MMDASLPWLPQAKERLVVLEEVVVPAEVHSPATQRTGTRTGRTGLLASRVDPLAAGQVSQVASTPGHDLKVGLTPRPGSCGGSGAHHHRVVRNRNRA
jgi:hypothetical protein